MSDEYKVLEQRRLRRQVDREASFAALEQRFSSTNVKPEILDLSHTDLIAKLQSRQLKAFDVLAAFVWKSLQVTRQINCITEFHPQMLEWAEQLDSLDKPKGPLHGLPFCIKDDHDVIGMDTTVGCSALLDKPVASSCVVVQVLVDAGAIPFCKTNLPQTAFSFRGHNPIFGETLNPWDQTRTPGGTSSGTGALVAAGGALFGTCSDIGGSARFPAHFCGVTGMLQTVFRNSVRGITQIGPDEAGGVYTQICLIGCNADLLGKIYRVLWESKAQTEYDPSVAPLGWNPEAFESPKRCTIGYLTSDPFFPTIGDTSQVVLNAKESLEASGHNLIPFEVPNLKFTFELFANLVGGSISTCLSTLEHDEISPTAEKFYPDRYPPPVLKTRRQVPPNPRAGETEVNWNYLKLQREYKNMLLDTMKAQDVDLVLMPTVPFAACRIEDCEVLFASAVYTAVWNMVGFPAISVPFGTESGAKIEEYDDEDDDVLKKVKESLRNSAGLPIGVQLAAKPWNDELLLGVARELEAVSTFKRPNFLV